MLHRITNNSSCCLSRCILHSLLEPSQKCTQNTASFRTNSVLSLCAPVYLHVVTGELLNGCYCNWIF
jgi:hypothetical protein